MEDEEINMINTKNNPSKYTAGFNKFHPSSFFMFFVPESHCQLSMLAEQTIKTHRTNNTIQTITATKT